MHGCQKSQEAANPGDITLKAELACKEQGKRPTLEDSKGVNEADESRIMNARGVTRPQEDSLTHTL
jgi:hypothetical protein